MSRVVVIVFWIGLSAFGYLSTYDFGPQHFPKPLYDFSKNPLEENKIILGRKLFYDPILSIDNTVSCASCHSPYNAFAHTDHALSHGVYDSIGLRNAPALFNLAWHSTFMWDGAIENLDMQALAPIHDSKEMGESINHVIQKLQQSHKYKSLFYKAYGDSTISSKHVLKALAQFQLTLVSANAKYDRVMQHKDSFTIQENNGYELFLQHCNACHTAPLFTNGAFVNNGLAIDTTLNDVGLYGITGQDMDKQKFKIPSLRNLGFTYPYMHDGRYKRLSEVLRFYTSQASNGKNVDHRVQGGIKLSSNEKVDLIAFLITLNDTSFVKNINHQYPHE
jgi:cytochrome c peroxidase